MNYYIITGASRGIGEAIVRQLLVPGNVIFAAARNLNEDISEMALAQHIPFYFNETDLSDSNQAIAFIHDVLSKIELKANDRIALINNAGMLEPVAPVGRIDKDLLNKHIALNLVSPMLLASAFIQATRHCHNTKIILNISSGASTYPYHGWSAYCTSKAGIDMFTKVAGLEQAQTAYPVKVFALAPGIIETDMQTQIRASQAEDFPSKENFVELFEQGKLLKPEFVASVIVAGLFSSRIENGSILNIDQLKEIAGV